MRLLAIILAAGALTASAVARAETIFVHAGRLVDVDASVVRYDQMIRVENDRISAVRPWVAPPAGATVIDWSNKTVLPGLIDMHTHLVGDIQSAGLADPLTYSEAEDALLGARNARVTLRAGFTSVRDVGVWRAFTDVALRDAINAGQIDGPRMAVAGGYFTIPEGGGTITGLADDVTIPPAFVRGVVNGPDDARAKAREFLQRRVDFIKMIATGAVLTVGTEPGRQELSEAEMRAIVDEARHYGKKVSAHAHGAEGAKAAIRAGVHSIEHGSILDDEALSMMKKRSVYLVADIYNGDYIDEIGTRDGWPDETLRKNRETTETQRDVFRKAVRTGVKIAYGTDSGVYPHGDNAKQLPYMVKYGMTPMQAIRSATIVAADLLDWRADVGSIAPGKFADMIAVDGDPLADIAALTGLKIVMKGGVLVD